MPSAYSMATGDGDHKIDHLLARLNAAIEAFPEREIVLEWILDEWDAYATAKFGIVDKRSAYIEWMADDAWGPNGDWRRQVLQYADRSYTFLEQGRDDAALTLRGLQAAMKMGTTLLDGLATMIVVFGLPPGPGPSGEIKEWVRGG